MANVCENGTFDVLREIILFVKEKRSENFVCHDKV